MNEILEREGTVVCRLPHSKNWGLFHSPCETKSIQDADAVLPALEWLEKNLSEGKYAAGFISYEAANAFDSANTVKRIPDFPLLWFSIYDKPPEIFSLNDFSQNQTNPGLSPVPEIKRESYLKTVGKIKDLIYDGDTYQVNFTFRARCGTIKNPEDLFLRLFKSHPVPYAAFINTGIFQVVSLSPELFLEKTPDGIFSLPMKGTAKRELTAEKDRAAAKKLSRDIKNRAENVMIVDMVRNDFGRICKPGSIRVSPLFKVQTFQTVHQMISGVHGKPRTGISIKEILSANFPPPSVTGAPKIRTMQIISDTEISPRKVYTGAIGCFMPDGNFCLNVAIRTIVCEKNKSELGIGSGIVADSDAEDEWKECLLKSFFANFAMPEFDVLETILWEKNKGFIYLDEHLKRARNSQKYFGGKWKREQILKSLEHLDLPKDAKFARVRLRISRNGDSSAEFAILKKKGWPENKLRICISEDRTDSKNVFLYHKTTNRNFYDDRYKKAIANGFDEVIFLNEKGEITEGAVSNIFIRQNNKWLTPPVFCGLLPGIWRKKMMKELKAGEKVIYPEDLKNADEIIIGNSVRGGGKVKIIHNFKPELIYKFINTKTQVN